MFEFKETMAGESISCRITVQSKSLLLRAGKSPSVSQDARAVDFPHDDDSRILIERIGNNRTNNNEISEIEAQVFHVLLFEYLGNKSFFKINYLHDRVKEEQEFRDALLKFTRGTLLRESYPPPPSPPPPRDPSLPELIY